jgi:two-component system chemotaxis sensor kinase CheA
LRPIVQRLDGVTSQMQDAVLLTRMQPVGNLFGKFPRMVRDLARQIGKEIELDIQGTEVELDKTILESLSDPLTHLIRNSCDHGIEPPQQRARAGKPTTGRIHLSAHHEGGQIRIEVRDDGKGIDPAVLKRKAVESGLRAPAEVARLSDKDALSLILLPGFSTAATVTDVSGRGVGMDVVKTNLDQLGGSLDIESTVGEGTAFHLRLPLTLAIIPCLLVQTDAERYAIPQKDLEELVCVRPEQARGRIEYAYDREVYRLRDRLLPLVRLADVLAHPEPFTAATRKELLRQHPSNGENQLLSFAVVKVGARRFGLVVDRILNNEEIVVKPMHPELKSLTCYSGATILGDGRVALILDIAGIARHAGVFAALELPQAAPANGQAEQDRQPVLLFQYGEREQFAVALAMIRRIELIRKERMETIGDKEYVTLDGVPTRVLRLDHFLNVSPGVDRDPLFLLLPRNLPRPLGILASNLIDTEQLVVELNTDSHTEDGLLGTAIVRGRMTLFLDIFRLSDKLDPARLEDRRPHALPQVKRRVLLVDDTQFFREVVKGYLEAEGYEVETAVDGADGLKRLDAAEFDLVVSDIEMPVLDGWGFARAVRRRGSDVPLLALTTLSTDADRDKALACGFDRYEVKLDRERFLAAVAELLPERTPAR